MEAHAFFDEVSALFYLFDVTFCLVGVEFGQESDMPAIYADYGDLFPKLSYGMKDGAVAADYHGDVGGEFGYVGYRRFAYPRGICGVLLHDGLMPAPA